MNETKKLCILEFEGVAERCLYDSDRYKIYAMRIDKSLYPFVKQNKYNNVTITGELPSLAIGSTYSITTDKECKGRYGVSYQVSNIKRKSSINNSVDMYAFLQEILTPKQAITLYEEYPDIVDRVKNNRLDDIDFTKLKGIKEKTFEVIKRKIIENYCLSDLVVEFEGCLPYSVLKQLYDRYSSIEVVKKRLTVEPYECLCELSGIGFKKADDILLEIDRKSKENIKQGKNPIIDFKEDMRTSKQRCLSAVEYILQNNETDGHTKMHLATLRQECLSLVKECANHFDEVIEDEKIYHDRKESVIALKITYNAEKYIAETVYKTVVKNNKKDEDSKENEESIKEWSFDIDKYSKSNSKFDKSAEWELSDNQKQAIINLCKYSISILNGNAGTGKSFTTKSIIKMLKDNKKTYKLFAPTGKAAKVMSAYTNETASTIHRGLGYVPSLRNPWTYNQKNKLVADVIIVDEFSMVDIWLFMHLIDAIDFTQTRLLLIGDDAQLPSVGCGNLMHDFFASKLIPTVTLDKVFRYQDGGLMKVATDVRMGKTYLTNDNKSCATAFGNTKDYMYIDVQPDDVLKNVLRLYKKLLKDKEINVNNIQVLTSKNVGELGTIALNNELQKIYNKNYNSRNNMKVGSTVFYVNDVVVQKSNNYKAENANNSSESVFVANGETGIIKSISNDYMIINFDGISVKYYKGEGTNTIGLGYCTTIHKSQGSSVDYVILVTPKSHTFMLNSNLIYVGLTRTKKQCYHVGQLATVNLAVGKKADLMRDTFMQELLKMFVKIDKNTVR